MDIDILKVPSEAQGPDLHVTSIDRAKHDSLKYMHSFKWVSVWSGERLHYWQLCKFKLIALCTNLSVTGVTASLARPADDDDWTPARRKLFMRYDRTNADPPTDRLAR